jgi:thiosulfate/3-mercaptopyruvate sulfurtransferase
MSALVMPEELLDHRDGVTFLDVRWQLGRAEGRGDFERGHVPGARFVDLEADLAGPPGKGGRHPLPDVDAFGEAMRRCGVSSSRPVVVYDDVAGTSAARAWWLLRHHGHPDVRLLDGGWCWWRRLGGPVETGPGTGTAEATYGDFRPAPGRMPVVDAAGAATLARDGVLVDARAPDRFRGEHEPVDPVAGHVPGAVNVPTARNVVAEGKRAGRWRTRDELAPEYRFALEPGTDVGVYCGSGVTAAHDVLALELLGVGAALYAGSWSAWVTDPTRPVATA